MGMKQCLEKLFSLMQVLWDEYPKRSVWHQRKNSVLFFFNEHVISWWKNLYYTETHRSEHTRSGTVHSSAWILACREYNFLRFEALAKLGGGFSFGRKMTKQ